MRILSVGNLHGESNTCLHRHWALTQLVDQIDTVSTNNAPVTFWYRVAYHLFLYGIPVRLPENSNENQNIILLVSKNNYDMIWIDKGVTINRKTLEYIKSHNPTVRIVSYSPDNMALRYNQSQNYLESLPLYDYIFNTKSYNFAEMQKLGAKKVYFVNKSYESSFHCPRLLTHDDIERLGGDVGFVGTWEKERCESILFLVDNGICVRVFGNGKWNAYRNYSPNLKIESGLFSDDYPKALQAFKISLCFLRKINFDQQTSRTMEIPACGGFLLAERTEEHKSLFKERKEAVFFSSNEELLEHCRYYLAHEEERQEIARAGRLRCETSGYSNLVTVQKMLDIINGK